MNENQKIYVIAHAVYLAIGVIYLIRANRNPAFPLKDLWFAYLYGWPYVSFMAARWRITWWRIVRTSPDDVEKLMRILRLRKMVHMCRLTDSNSVFYVTYLDGATRTYRISEQECVNTRHSPYLPVARKILTRARSDCK